MYRSMTTDVNGGTSRVVKKAEERYRGFVIFPPKEELTQDIHFYISIHYNEILGLRITYIDILNKASYSFITIAYKGIIRKY